MLGGRRVGRLVVVIGRGAVGGVVEVVAVAVAVLVMVEVVALVLVVVVVVVVVVLLLNAGQRHGLHPAGHGRVVCIVGLGHVVPRLPFHAPVAAVAGSEGANQGSLQHQRGPIVRRSSPALHCRDNNSRCEPCRAANSRWGSSFSGGPACVQAESWYMTLHGADAKVPRFQSSTQRAWERSGRGQRRAAGRHGGRQASTGYGQRAFEWCGDLPQAQPVERCGAACLPA